ncbi:MAG: GFA family protein [Burkholderiales bacterium]
MHHGSCLCGTIRYEVTGELGTIVLCHCPQCRKAQGTAFGANAAVRASDFKLLSGEDALAAYESSPGKKRIFCKICGSPIISSLDSRPGVVRLRIGTLDSKIDARPTAHIYVGSKADWFDIHDALPQHSKREPGR